ncbi:MAG: SpaA isopeptide-forming pilin-related protein [Pseudoclavibacter sp.]
MKQNRKARSAARAVLRGFVMLCAAVLVCAGGQLVSAATGQPAAAPQIPQAMAAANLSCTTGTVYALGSNGNLYQVNTTTGATTSVTTMASSINALGVAKDGSAAYAVEQAATSNRNPSVSVYKYTASTGQTTNLGSVNVNSVILGSYLVGGAMSPTNGIYYFGGWTANGFALFGWNTTTNTAIGFMGYVTVPGFESPANGDIVFDSSGDLYVINSNSGDQSMGVVQAPSVPTGAGNSTIAASTVATGANNVAFNGAAYDGTGTLFLSTGTYLNEGNGFAGSRVNFTGGLSAVDLAGCSFPGSLTLKKNALGRVNGGDQFGLSVAHSTGSGTVTDSSATTTGTATGVQPVTAGPVVGYVGTQYTISEAGANGANLANYISTYSCVYADGTAFASGTGTSAVLPAFPDSTARNNAITCTFTNQPNNGTASWAKEDGSTGALLSGSTWTLTGPTGSSSQTRTVTDCVGSQASSCSGLVDQDWRAGMFSVTGLQWGTYTLKEATAPGGYSPDPNTYTKTIGSGALTADFGVILNTKIPAATVTISKTVQDVNGQNPQAGSGWTVGASLASASTSGTTITTPATQQTGSTGSVPTPWSIAFPSGSATASVTVSETQQTGYAFVSGTCTVTPASGTATTVNLGATSGTVAGVTPGSTVACAFTNKQQPGTATWQKVASDTAKTLLSGSQWTLTGPGIASGGVTVTDCTASSCTATSASAPTDQDSAKGSFELTNLAWGDYTLVEKTAPVGYALDTTAHTFTISATSLSPTVTGSPFSNAQQAVPKLPLTGGASADAYLMAGTVLLMLSCALGIIGVRRRKGDAKRH